MCTAFFMSIRIPAERGPLPWDGGLLRCSTACGEIFLFILTSEAFGFSLIVDIAITVFVD